MIEDVDYRMNRSRDFNPNVRPEFTNGGRKIGQMLTDYGDSKMPHNPDDVVVEEYTQSDLILSHIDDECTKHKPAIDIDMPVHVIESSTPGKSHLYIDKEMSWDDYLKLLRVMVEVGLVEEGYLGASEYRGYTTLRKPGNLKEGSPGCQSQEIPF